jgi:NodT family efflux transporter outer membrane factor (OMF) lipoprotein
MRRVLAASILTVALGGCAVGPRYHAPPTPKAGAGAFVAATSAVAAPQAPPDRWWELYQDPAIDALVQQALVHNTDLRVAAANLAQARGALLASRAGLFPSTRESAGANFQKNSTVNPSLGTTLQGAWIYEAAFDASYELDLWGRIRRGIQAAKADVAARAAAEDFVRVTVAAETTRAYVDACAYAEEAAVARRSLDLVTQTYQITQKQVALGSASEFDLARAATLVEQTRATIPPIEDAWRSSLYQLSVLTGKPPEEIDAAAAKCARPPQLTTPLPVGDGASLLRRRPDVREAERSLAASVARVGVATAELFPTVTLNGSIGGSALKPAKMFSTSGLNYSAGPLISWNFPNLVAQEGALAEAKAVASGALAQFDAAVLGALRDTETALSAYAGEIDRHKALQTARDQAQIAFKLAGVRYQGGEASYLDVLTAETTLVNADQALATSDQALVSDQVSVFKALGGGWQHAPKPAEKSGWTR